MTLVPWCELQTQYFTSNCCNLLGKSRRICDILSEFCEAYCVNDEWWCHVPSSLLDICQRFNLSHKSLESAHNCCVVVQHTITCIYVVRFENHLKVLKHKLFLCTSLLPTVLTPFLRLIKPVYWPGGPGLVKLWTTNLCRGSLIQK